MGAEGGDSTTNMETPSGWEGGTCGGVGPAGLSVGGSGAVGPDVFEAGHEGVYGGGNDKMPGWLGVSSAGVLADGEPGVAGVTAGKAEAGEDGGCCCWEGKFGTSAETMQHISKRRKVPALQASMPLASCGL